MDALCRAKAKTNRRGSADGAVMRIAAAQALQAQGQESGGLHAPLWRSHARRVVQVGKRQGCPAEMSNQQEVSYVDPIAVSQHSVVTSVEHLRRRPGALPETRASALEQGMRNAPGRLYTPGSGGWRVSSGVR